MTRKGGRGLQELQVDVWTPHPAAGVYLTLILFPSYLPEQPDASDVSVCPCHMRHMHRKQAPPCTH